MTPFDVTLECPVLPVLPLRADAGTADKRLPDLAAALAAAGVRDGMTISFHHHLRNGDGVLNAVMQALAGAGIGDLTLAPSSVFAVHAPLVGHIAHGTVSGLHTAYMAGPVAQAVGQGALSRPAVLQTHGGRARDIETGRLRVDVAFVAAAMADRSGNLTGAHGPSAFGPLGYGQVDAARARCVIAVTDCLVDKLPCAPDIPAAQVDHVVVVERIGEAANIASGTTRITTDPAGLHIAAMAADLIAASGLMQDGMSFQTGAGGTSLAVAARLGHLMAGSGVVAGFVSGGITAPIVALHRAGLARRLWNVQSFDLDAVHSYAHDALHNGMSASLYANPARSDAIVNKLDVMILGATEVGAAFDVNVTTGSDGGIMGGSGGHADAAAGAKLAIVVTPLETRGWPRLVKHLTCRTTPGAHIDAVVTPAGIAINPKRPDLESRARHAGLPVMTLEAMRALCPPRPDKPLHAPDAPVVAVCEYRDGRVIDLVRQQPG
ncbi:citrate lyase subunit alpha [Seohaeicola saemankumensis]|uniref:citrate lyase subunit alpha n=1 Tax=Seohaeicola saemankumensis TaxID=481181 RepID=UPI001E429396|nr:citrate lyase subunit alpha [Seohaeicola saemankumensis]MCD1625904.1 citrate lyase subunit alpha [Seohaeicola saemankumensis]